MLKCRFVLFPVLLFLAFSSRLFSQVNCSVSVTPGSASVCAGFSVTLTAFGANSYTWTSGSLTAAVIGQSIAVSAGTYMVKGNVNTCVDSTVVTVSLSPPLNVPLTVSSHTSCKESNSPAFSIPVTMSVSGAASYYWVASTSQPNFPVLGPTVITRPASTTCYTVTGSTSMCSGSAVTCVTIIPQFTVNVAPAQSTICEGDQVFLVVAQIGGVGVGPTSSFTFRWDGPPGTINSPFSHSVLVSPVSNAIYTVELHDSRGCISAPFFTSVHVQECTSAEEIEKSETPRIFPNPFTSFVNVEAPVGVTISIFNCVGERLSADIQTGTDRISIRTEFLSQGIYFLRIENQEGKTFTHKILKE
jgi:hypothetical protein